MSRRQAIAIVVLVAVWLLGGQEVASAQGQFRIQEIRAMPYYTQTGEIRRSANLFNPMLALRNVILGSPSDTLPVRIADWDVLPGTTVTYVEVVVVASGVKQLEPSVQMEFDVRGLKARVIKRERVNLAALHGENQKVVHIPFIVPDTGCEKLEIRARIVGAKGDGSERSGVIPFTCGE